jgi:NADPH:quinone reductase-like Zn-dependent oxidoreductase
MHVKRGDAPSDIITSSLNSDYVFNLQSYCSLALFRTNTHTMASVQEVKAWTYTSGGFPKGLKPATVLVPRANDIKGLGTTAHMLVKIKACALNPVDVQMINLMSSIIPLKSYQKEKGTVCDFSAVVDAGGRTGFIRGDEIFGMTLAPYKYGGGALAEMAEFDMANTVAVKKPAEWSHTKAAAISLVWLTARTCIEDVSNYIEDASSKRIAVLGGSSAVGIYTILLAKRRGWKVLTTSSGRNKDFVTSTLGADEHVDYTSVPSVRSAIQEFLPDAIIDCVGGTECIGLPSSKRYITIVGDKTGRTSMGGPYTYYNFLSYHAPVQWLRWARGQLGFGESYDVVILDMKKEWLEEAKETLTPDQIFVDSEFGFDDALKAFERLNTGRARGKVVINIA